MSKVATKAVNNIYYQARIKGSYRNPKIKSRNGAAELLHINPTTLAKYELDILNVSSEMAKQMSKAYNIPELLNWHCCKCSIGKKPIKITEIKDLSNIASHLVNLLNYMDEVKGMLVNLADNNNKIEITPCMINYLLNFFLQLKQSINEFEVTVNKK